MIKPTQIDRIGNEIAIRWEDGREDYFPESILRRYSPSAENVGERDLVGKIHGGAEANADYSHVTVTGWSFIGGYAIRFKFSDGHTTGLYSYGYLQKLGDFLKDKDAGSQG